jgi:hypothetical protein
MDAGPPKALEIALGILIPPACREEVIGDLHERYRSLGHYLLEVVHTVPLVIASRIRRTSDPQVMVMQALAAYLSFLGAAWLRDRALLDEPWGLMRLAIPAAMILVGLILDDAYSKPGKRTPLQLVRGPVLGVALAFASQALMPLPMAISFLGCTMSLPLTSAVRVLFPPVTDQLEGVSAPAIWLKRQGEPVDISPGVVSVLKAVALVVLAIVAAWISLRR